MQIKSLAVISKNFFDEWTVSFDEMKKMGFKFKITYRGFFL